MKKPPRLSDRSGELSLAALLVSLASGFVVAYQYEVAEPFTSSVAIEAAMPFGDFFRSLHFWSSQAFLLLLLWHTWKSLAHLTRLSTSASGRRYWLILSSTIFLAIFVLFSGYILRYDQTGRDACTIAEHLIKAIPVAGNVLNSFLIARDSEGLNRVYAVHFLFTATLWGLGTWYHSRKVLLRKDAFLTVLVPVILFSAIVHAPIDLPESNVAIVKGPWFFLGIQELLRHIPPLWAGVIFPAIPLVLLTFLPYAKKRAAWYTLIGGWMTVYGALTMISWLR